MYLKEIKHEIYMEAHIRIAEIIEGMDMDDFDKIANSERGVPSDEVMAAMDNIANNHRQEAKNLESEVEIIGAVHANLVAP